MKLRVPRKEATILHQGASSVEIAHWTRQAVSSCLTRFAEDFKAVPQHLYVHSTLHSLLPLAALERLGVTVHREVILDDEEDTKIDVDTLVDQYTFFITEDVVRQVSLE